MKKTLIFFFTLVISLTLFFIISETLYAFEWIDRMVIVRNQDQIEDGDRLFLMDQDQRSFVIIAGKGLLTDEQKERILSYLAEIHQFSELGITNVEFKLKPSEYRILIQLSENGKTIGIFYPNLNPPDDIIKKMIPLYKDLTSWQKINLRMAQFNLAAKSIQVVLAPQAEGPIVNILLDTPSPGKAIFDDLSEFYMATLSWDNLKATDYTFEVKENRLQLNIALQGKERNIVIKQQSVKPDKDLLDKTTRLYNVVQGWKNITFRNLYLTLRDQKVDAAIVPSEFTNNQKNLLPHLPAGMTFAVEEKISYDFKVTSDNYIVRVFGEYENEKRLARFVAEAASDPILYLRTYNPEYFYRQLDKVLGKYYELQESNEALEIRHEELVLKHEALKGEHESLEKKNEALKAEHEALAGKHQTLLEDYEKLKQSHEKFLYGMITLENSGFLGTKAVNKDAIRRIVELKNANPEITEDEVSKVLDEEQLDVSTKVISTVFSLYFNEFE